MLNLAYDIDMSKGTLKIAIPLKQYETDWEIALHLFSSRDAFDITDVDSIALRGTKPDGLGYSDTLEFTTTDGLVATIEGDVQLTAVSGKAPFEIVCYDDEENEIISQTFYFCIERAALDLDTVSSQSKIREIVEITERTDEILAAAASMAESAEAVEGYAAEAAGYRTEAQYAKNSAEAMAYQATLAKQAAESAVNNAVSDIQDAKSDGINGVNAAKLAAIADFNEETGQAHATIAELQNNVSGLNDDVSGLQNEILSFCDELEVDSEGLVYLLHNGERIAGPYGPFAGGGGGGGGGGNNAVLTVTNTSGFLSKTISEGGTCNLSLTWSSLENELSTGNGTLKIIVNGNQKLSQDVAQGSLTVNVAPYCTTGSNVVKVQIADIYGNTRTISFNITVVSISINSSFDGTLAQTGAFQFSYTPVGAVAKTVYFKVDGTTVATETTSISGRQLSKTIPAQTHGAHTLDVYFTADINGETVTSNVLHYDLICLETGEDDVIIASPYNVSSVSQYSTINIPYIVYDPSASTASVSIKANGTTVASGLTVDRTQQTFTYRCNTTGSNTIQFISGNTTKSITFTVTEVQIDVEAETEDLKLYLSSYGRSNNETPADRSKWEYGNISSTLSNFNWASDGWLQDDDGITVLRVSGNARVSIPYKIFENEFKRDGKKIEIEFATRDVRNYDSIIMSCFSDSIGIKMSSNNILMKSEQSEINAQFKENEHVRLSFVVEKNTEHRLIYVYINGIMSGTLQYPATDSFSQTTAANISIGSNDSTIDIYCIRVYDNSLTKQQILEGWIADTQDGGTMLDRYVRNNVYDEYGQIVISKLPSSLPYMVISCDELPQYKGDKKTVAVAYTDPLNAAKSFTATGVQADVQGTSSQYYARKNYKLKFKNGFTMTQSGSTVSKYQMKAGAIETSTFCFKADVASSEGANNVELARLYNDVCPYKTPLQAASPNIRQGIDGFPIVIFWYDTTNDTMQFLGKYNFNNDKSTSEVFGFVSGDESWEIKNNTSNRVIWKDDDYTGSDWLNDFEARYPDTDPPYEDPTQLANFAEWIVSTDQSAATGDDLDESVTYDGTTYTKDTAAYRLAKFKAEAGNYMEMQSTLFYYLFTELFLMVDSRAKNAFPSFMGSVISEDDYEIDLS